MHRCQSHHIHTANAHGCPFPKPIHFKYTSIYKKNKNNNNKNNINWKWDETTINLSIMILGQVDINIYAQRLVVLRNYWCFYPQHYVLSAKARPNETGSVAGRSSAKRYIPHVLCMHMIHSPSYDRPSSVAKVRWNSMYRWIFRPNELEVQQPKLLIWFCAYAQFMTIGLCWDMLSATAPQVRHFAIVKQRKEEKMGIDGVAYGEWWVEHVK